MRHLIFLLPLFAFVWLVVYFSLSLGKDPSVLTSVLIDQPPPNFNLPPLAAREPNLTRDDLGKGRVSLVNFFASWCSPCLAELPSLLQLSKEGFIIYGIAYKDKPAELSSWLARNGSPYRRVGLDETGRTAIDWGVYGVPETYIIDRHERVRYRHVGIITPEIKQKTLLPILSRLEAEP